jgi:hypothetical protein
MQSFDLPLIISNAHEHTSADLGHITPSEVHRVTLTKMFCIPRNMYVLINDAMRQRLNLGFDETSPPHTFGSWIDSILISRGPYRICENVYGCFHTAPPRFTSTYFWQDLSMLVL